MMKKILLVILTFSAAFAANAQWCGNVNSFTPNPGAPVGFPAFDGIPCAVQGVAYADTISFQMYTAFNYLGAQTIDSVTIDTMWNLPCGLCWSFNKANRTYAASEFGVLYIGGTTSDDTGEYNLAIQLTAYINHDPAAHPIQNPNTVNAAGIWLWVRVRAANGACTPVDTDQNYPQQTSHTPCAGVGINEVAVNVASLNIVPNPISSSAQLTFTAEKNASYSVKIMDITGKVISVKEIQANPGLNTSELERGNLSSGVYLLSLSDGVSSITRKFTVVE